MFQFLSSLFTRSAERPEGVNDQLVEAAMERVIQGTDKRLLGIASCRRRLREPVEKAVVHVIKLIDALPEPVEISRRTFGSDPRLHAFFASFDHMQEKIGAAKTVEAYLKQAAVDGKRRLYGLLSMQWEERNRLGTVLQDDRLQREVQQVSVNFLNHNFIGPSLSPDEARLNVKKRAFDFMIEITLERLIAARNRRVELEQQQLLLERKLKMMRAGNWGFEGLLRPEMSGAEEFIGSLEAEIESVEAELAKMGASHEVLDRNLQTIIETLDRPDELLAMRNIEIELDGMNIRADTSTAARIHKLELNEIYSGIGVKRILLPGWFPLEELPAEREAIANAMRYL